MFKGNIPAPPVSLGAAPPMPPEPPPRPPVALTPPEPLLPPVGLAPPEPVLPPEPLPPPLALPPEPVAPPLPTVPPEPVVPPVEAPPEPVLPPEDDVVPPEPVLPPEAAAPPEPSSPPPPDEQPEWVVATSPTANRVETRRVDTRGATSVGGVRMPGSMPRVTCPATGRPAIGPELPPRRSQPPHQGQAPQQSWTPLGRERHALVPDRGVRPVAFGVNLGAQIQTLAQREVQAGAGVRHEGPGAGGAAARATLNRQSLRRDEQTTRSHRPDRLPEPSRTKRPQGLGQRELMRHLGVALRAVHPGARPQPRHRQARAQRPAWHGNQRCPQDRQHRGRHAVQAGQHHASRFQRQPRGARGGS